MFYSQFRIGVSEKTHGHMYAKLGSVHTKSRSWERLIAVTVAFPVSKDLARCCQLHLGGCLYPHMHNSTRSGAGAGGKGEGVMKLQAWTAGSPLLLSPPHTEERVMANSQ